MFGNNYAEFLVNVPLNLWEKDESTHQPWATANVFHRGMESPGIRTGQLVS